MKHHDFPGHGTIYNGDCQDLLATLPDKSIDLVLTDPPYGGSVCRTGGRTRRYESGERLHVSRTGGSWAEKYGKKIAQWDIAPTQEVFDEIFRVSKNQIIWGAITSICRQQDALTSGANYPLPIPSLWRCASTLGAAST